MGGQVDIPAVDCIYCVLYRFKADLRRAHDKEVVFIGMHIRRTDYVQYSKQVQHKQKHKYYNISKPTKLPDFLAIFH